MDLRRAQLDADAVARGERVGAGIDLGVDEQVEAVEADPQQARRPGEVLADDGARQGARSASPLPRALTRTSSGRDIRVTSVPVAAPAGGAAPT